MIRRLGLGLLVLACLAIAIPAHAGPGGKTPDRIWVLSDARLAPSSLTMRYGDAFSAGWESTKIANPFALAQCWIVDASGNKMGGPFWASWRWLQADGTIGPFIIASVDPKQYWPIEGGRCNVSLVLIQGNKQTVTAVSEDFVAMP